MTTKERFIPYPGGETYVWTNKDHEVINSGVIPFSSDPTVIREHSIIQYENKGRQADNNCIHISRKSSHTPGKYTLDFSKPGIPGDKYTYGNVAGWAPNFAAQLFTTHGLLSGVPVGFFQRSYQVMRPKLESELSIPNFFIELRDVRRLFPSIVSSVENILLRRSKGVSDAILTKTYGIDPLVGDLKRMATALSSLKKEAQKLRQNSGKPNKRFYSETIDVSSEKSEENWGSIIFGHEVDPCQIKYTAAMTYSYEYDVSAIPDFNLMLASYLGFRAKKLPEILWDAIPFSFVVDWVLKIGDFLSQFDDGVIPCRVVVTHYTLSGKYERKAKSYFRENPDFKHIASMSPSYFSTGTHVLRHYVRLGVCPDLLALTSTALPRIDGLSIRELVLGASLINSNLR